MSEMKLLNLTINGCEFNLPAGAHETLAQVIRNRAGLTGTKIGCEHGNCGACTVLVNGNAVLSCITPALRCEGVNVQTIEGLAVNGELHPLQEKFIEKGAIQCGFCTPGMVMTALEFTSKNPGASEPEIREALSGNVCRCTGYKKIVEAVSEYAGEKKRTCTPQEVPENIVGSRRPYLEAGKKVRGAALYTDDIRLHNALHCKILRSIYPHARIVSIDTSEAERMPGVRGVTVGAELPEKFGVLPISHDETAMAIDKVRHIGEPIAAVAADTEEIADAALKKIKVVYEPLKPFFEIEESLKEITPEEKIHSYTRHTNNVHKKAELRFGDQQQGLNSSAVVSSMNFEFEGVSHAFTEPHAAAAYWDENGLTLISATQVPHYLHRSLAQVLKVPLSRVRVIKPVVGGGFGGKGDPFPHEMIVAHLARKTGRPVRIRFSREEVFISNHGRHPSKMKISLGAGRDGKFTALDADIAIDGGAFGSFGVVTSYYNGVLLQAPYKIDNFGFRTFRVYTNKPQCGAMRGHGAVNSRFAVECLIDDIAHRLGMDACEIRMKNFLTPNTLTVGQYRITSNGSRESLQKVMEQSRWNERYGKLPYGHGLGVGCGFFISGSALPILWNDQPQSVVHLKVDFDGRVLVTSGASDIGQGSDTMLAMVVAETLGLQVENISVVAADTLLTPVDLGSYSSRVTFMAGNAAKNAAENLKAEIISAVSKKKNILTEELNLSGGRIFSHDRSLDISWNEAVDILTAHRGAVAVSGKYISPKLGGDFKGAGAGLSPSYSFGAVVAEVKVDPDTGIIKIVDMWGAHDCGKAINPLAVEGQLEGSWHMGLGQAISEQMKYHGGLLLNNNFLDYKIPTTLDTPDIKTNIIETNDPEGPFGAKECGEGALHPSLPAVANAIFDAVGVRVTKLPVSAEEVLNKIKVEMKIKNKILM